MAKSDGNTALGGRLFAVLPFSLKTPQRPSVGNVLKIGFRIG